MAEKEDKYVFLKDRIQPAWLPIDFLDWSSWLVVWAKFSAKHWRISIPLAFAVTAWIVYQS